MTRRARPRPVPAGALADAARPDPARADSRGADSRGADSGRADAGSAALELVVLAPVLLVLLALVIAAGRTSIAQSSVDAAARDAARQASLALNPTAAQQAGVASARQALRDDGLDCVTETVTVDTGGADAGFGVAPGTPASVSATVSCAVPLSDLFLPGLPGAHKMSATFSSPLDVFRER
jgi:Flp pilus assembly protein TadG